MMLNQKKEYWLRRSANKELLILLGLMLLTGCQHVARPVPTATVQPEKDANVTKRAADSAAHVHQVSATGGAVLPVGTAAPLVSTATSTATVALPAPAEEATVAVQNRDTAALVAAGQELYLKQYCGVCHQLDALGTQGTFGPPHNGMGQRAAERIADPDYQGHAQTAAAYLMESLTDPTAYTTPGYALTSHPMPNYSYLSEADRQALVAMLLDQR